MFITKHVHEKTRQDQVGGDDAFKHPSPPI